MSDNTKKAVCRCPAYEWPHRSEGGRCSQDSQLEEIWLRMLNCVECEHYTSDREGSYCGLRESTGKAADCPDYTTIVEIR